MMLIVETTRSQIRRLLPTDNVALTRLFGDVEVMRFGDGVQTAEWVSRWIADRIADYDRTNGTGPWTVVEQTRREVIGYCGLFFFPDVKGRAEMEIGYRLVQSRWGQGFATEAVIAVRYYAFQTLGLNRLIAIIDPQNTASIRVAEQAGLSYESDVMFSGYTHPDRVYAIERAVGEMSSG